MASILSCYMFCPKQKERKERNHESNNIKEKMHERKRKHYMAAKESITWHLFCHVICSSLKKTCKKEGNHESDNIKKKMHERKSEHYVTAKGI